MVMKKIKYYLFIKEMQISITIRYHFTATRIDTIIKTGNIKC